MQLFHLLKKKKLLGGPHVLVLQKQNAETKRSKFTGAALSEAIYQTCMK